MPEEDDRKHPSQNAASGGPRAILDTLASTRTAILLLALIALAAIVGTVSDEGWAREHVYGRAWFHFLLAFLAVNLVACMLWRRRLGLARAWSLLIHGGILLVLAGASVTLIWAERGAMSVFEGHSLGEYVPQGRPVTGRGTYTAATKTLVDPAARFLSDGVSAGATVFLGHAGFRIASVPGETSLVLEKGPASDIARATSYAVEPRPKPLGFVVRLVDFRIERYPPVHYLDASAGLRGTQSDRDTARVKIAPGKSTDIPGTGWSATVKRLPEGNAFIEAGFADGSRRDIPAEVGRTEVLVQGLAPPGQAPHGGAGRKATDSESARERHAAAHTRSRTVVIEVLRYVASFRIDRETKQVTSASDEPLNPAVEVRVSHKGDPAGEGDPSADGAPPYEGEPEQKGWLFARYPRFDSVGGRHHGERAKGHVHLRYRHPDFQEEAAVLTGPGGTEPVRVWAGGAAHAPWDPRTILTCAREAAIKEYESEVEILEEGKVVKRHVVRVNDPLVCRGTKLSQMDYDHERGRYTVLGVSRDRGAWIVYAGFIAMTIGLTGKFYVAPVLRSRRSGKAAEAVETQEAEQAERAGKTRTAKSAEKAKKAKRPKKEG